MSRQTLTTEPPNTAPHGSLNPDTELWVKKKKGEKKKDLKKKKVQGGTAMFIKWVTELYIKIFSLWMQLLPGLVIPQMLKFASSSSNKCFTVCKINSSSAGAD